MIIVRPQPEGESGAIVVAGMENQATHEDEVTVKRLRRSGSAVQLVAENPAYPPIDGADARVEGLVVGLTRAY